MQNKNLMIFILACGVFSILNTEMGIIGILPAAAAYYGVDIVQAGLLVSMFALGVAIAGPTMPLVCSRLRRKLIMATVLGIFTLCNIVAAIAPSFEVLLAARVIPAFFHPVYCAAAFSLAASLVEKKDAPCAVARINMGVAAGMVIGVPVSNFLAVTFGFTEAMSFFAVVTGIMLLLTIFFIPDQFPGEAKQYGEQLQILRRFPVWTAIITVILFNGSIFGVYNYLTEYLNEIAGIRGELASGLLLLYGLANVLGSYCGGRLLTFNAAKTVHSFPLLVAAMYMFIIFLSGGSLLLLTAGIAVWGLLGGINANVNQFLVATAAEDAPDFGNGLFLTAANIGCVAGTFLSGVFIRNYGLDSLIFTGLFLALVSGIFIACCHAVSRKQPVFVKL